MSKKNSYTIEDLWFFGCHFEGDPVMPGCLGLDAMWQLVGFYLGWKGGLGRGRALGGGEIKFTGQVLPTAKKITYAIDLKRVIMRKLIMGIADAKMSVDGREIYHAKDLRVGLFTSSSAIICPLPYSPPSSVIATMRSNISIGGSGS